VLISKMNGDSLIFGNQGIGSSSLTRHNTNTQTNVVTEIKKSPAFTITTYIAGYPVPQQPRAGKDGLGGVVSKIDSRKPAESKKKEFQDNCLVEKLLAGDHDR
jgi:hypothetical protein